MNDSSTNEFEKANLQQIISLHARIDALTAIVEILAMNDGATREQFRTGLKTVRETCIQKYLEKIEGRSPSVAATVDFSRDLSAIDQSLLDKLRWSK